MTTKLDLDALESKAKAAHSTWWIRDGSTRILIGDDGHTWSASLHLGPHNADHIAANSPPVTLALVSRIRELEAALGDAARAAESIYDTPVGASAPWRALLERGVVLP